MEFETGKNGPNRQQRRAPQHEPQVVNEFGELQPNVPEIEDAVLGALMLEKDAYSVVSDLLKPGFRPRI